MTGSARVAKAEPDGYQFVFGGVSTHAQVQLLHKKPPYDGASDFAPVALVAEQPLILVARNGIPAGNLRDFIAYAKANQAKMQYGSPGAGSGSHLACALLNVAVGIEVTHVPYRGLGPAMQDLLAGRIDYVCPTDHDRDRADRSPYGAGAGGADARTFREYAGCRKRAGAGPQGFRSL